MSAVGKEWPNNNICYVVKKGDIFAVLGLDYL